MKPLLIPALVAVAAFSSNAFADHDWDDGDRWEHRHHHHGERVIVQQVYEPPVVYQAPPVVYQAQPTVIYRDRVVYRDRPVYYEAAPQYEPPPPPQRYYEQPAAYPSSGGNRVLGQAVGAVAGGVIANRFGKGNGRVAATAVGAVLGSVVGGNMADYGRPY